MNPKSEADSAPILVTFAVKEEAGPFLRAAATLPAARLALTGMGRRNAEASTRQALAEQRPRLVITSGFAGGLNPSLRRGQVICSAEAEAGLADALRRGGATPATFLCAPRVAVTAREKAALRQSTGADAVEMESGFIRDLCRDLAVPCAIVRVISDSAGEDLPLDFNALMTPGFRMDFAKLALALLQSPAKIIELIRFQRQMNAAAARLAEVLAQIVVQFDRP